MDRPKLTKADLHEIKLRGLENPDVVAMLFEIHRLRGLALRADQLQKMLVEMGALKGWCSIACGASWRGSRAWLSFRG